MRIPWWSAPFLGSDPGAVHGPRFDASRAVVLDGADALAALQPSFMRALNRELEVDALAGRVCPVMLSDQSVALFALAEDVGSDHADELARRVVKRGYVLAEPQRYILAAPLLLAIARGQLSVRSLSARRARAEATGRTALAQAFHDLVEWGVRHGASDLHLNVHAQEPESEVKFTISGRYIAPDRFARMPTSTLMDMLAVAWMDIRGGNGAVFDPLVEQQGQMITEVAGKRMMLRWASLAADRGPSVCLRLLHHDRLARRESLGDLGYLPDQVATIERVMVSQGGAIVLAGTVGSGKSTTLAAMISGIAADRKVVTLEDPVEYLIPGAIQNTLARDLDVAAHEAYASKLRALKRSAMNDVLLGEIRDEETGRAFMDLAGSGVSVYTTVHAPSLDFICERLASDFIGVSRDFLASPGVLKLLIHQVLLPVLCPECALPGTAPPATHGPARWRCFLQRLERLFGLAPEKLRLRNPQGCSQCSGMPSPQLHGYAGRTVVAGLLEPNLVPGFLESVRAGRVGRSLGRGSAACALRAALVHAASGRVDPRDIEPEFLAFETLERVRHSSGAVEVLE